jgi:23S rRNA pseudouridine2605 synthase
MNANSQTSLPLDPDAATPESEETPVKPVRRRRTVKASEEGTAAVAPEALPAPVEVAEAPPKPKRRRTTAAAAAAAEPAPDQAPGLATVQPEPVRIDPVVVEPQPVQSRIDPVGGDSQSRRVRVDSVDGGPSTDDSAASAAQDGSELSADGTADEGGDGPRGRRRGRRDRKRGDRGETREPGSPEGVEGAAASLEPPIETGELFAQVLSGEFDVNGEPEPQAAEEDPAAAPKRVLLPEPEAPKLHKVLAQSGIGSRRDMEDLIADGHVLVNGEPAHVGQRVSFGDRVQVNGKPVKLRIVPPPPRIIAYHKPVGEIVTHDDPQNRPTVFRRLPRLQQGKWQSVGRLDINTEGLLLFTNSGELANQLMHPRFGVEREYAVRLLGTLTEENKAGLLAGVDVEGQKASFKSITEGGGDGANHWYRVVITEGRNREVRKLFDTVGLTVSRLIRIRYGTVVLPFGLKRGVWVDLEEGDVRMIRRLASGDRVDRGDRSDRGDQNGQRNVGRSNNEPRQGGQQPQRNDRQGGRPNDRQRGPRRDGNAPAPQAFVAEDVERSQERRDDNDEDMDFDPASIPNPLEQTFDKRFVSNPRSPVGGRGFRNGGGGGFGAGGSGPAPGPKRGAGGGQGGPKQPDPLQTSLGVFGADAFHRKNRGGGGGGSGQGGGGRGGSRGGGYGGGGGGGSGGNNGGGYGGGGRRGR